ncbi:MAG: phage tail protein [Hyphomicrobiales bacterium]|nr:MAG: phage tail protein [Hyphomicrobiales bacterium]
MSAHHSFELTGTAVLPNAGQMLDQICEHFVEHAEVERTADLALLTSKLGTARIRLLDRTLLIDLAAPTETALQVAQNSIAEHMFYFAQDEALDLTWSRTGSPGKLRNFHQAVVVGAQDITPHMRRVRVFCEDVAPFVGGDMHVRVLVPPKGRSPLWPGYRGDGRIAWPQGDDALLVRPYTIRAVDIERRELWIDVFQHPAPGITTPVADFARDAQSGDVVALLGPGSGGLPKARSILMIGDESALPAIARIAAEVEAGTEIRAIIEVLDAGEEQPLPSAAKLDVRWLHRRSYHEAGAGSLLEEARTAIEATDGSTFIWAACEKDDVRAIRSQLKERGHDKKNMYVAWYWETFRPTA